MNRIVKELTYILLAMAMLISSSTALAADSINWQNATITVTGFGATPPNAVNPTQGRLLARRAAIVDGYRQLAEVVKGVNVDTQTTVEDFMVTSDTITTNVHTVIRGAQVLSEREISGGYEVTMTIKMFGVSDSLANAVMQAPPKRESFPKPVQSVAPSMPAYESTASVKVRIDVTSTQPPKSALNSDPISGYTGLIVDCRGLGLKPVMSPVIKNADSEPIYGHKNLDPDYVISHGMASYTSDLNSGTSRAGSNPLVVKAVSLDDHSGVPVISVADANRVLIENESTAFLDKTNVVFVR